MVPSQTPFPAVSRNQRGRGPEPILGPLAAISHTRFSQEAQPDAGGGGGGEISPLNCGGCELSPPAIADPAEPWSAQKLLICECELASAWTPETLVRLSSGHRPQQSAWEAAPCPRAADPGPAGPRLEQPRASTRVSGEPAWRPLRVGSRWFPCTSSAVGAPGPCLSPALRTLLGTESGGLATIPGPRPS